MQALEALGETNQSLGHLMVGHHQRRRAKCLQGGLEEARETTGGDPGQNHRRGVAAAAKVHVVVAWVQDHPREHRQEHHRERLLVDRRGRHRGRTGGGWAEWTDRH